MTNSPARPRPPAERITDLTGAPKCRAIAGDQSTRKPTFDASNGASVAPARASASVHAPSEPSRAQDAPPSASTVARAATRRGPSGVSNVAAAPSQPVQRQRVRRSAPDAASRPSQARSRGEAFIARGNTRPDEPVKTSRPRPRAQSWTSAGPNAEISGAMRSAPRQ